MFARIKHRPFAILILSSLVLMLGVWPAPADAAALNTMPPASTVPLVFIHHSTGENWLADGNGGLGQELMNNNYYVSDTNYGWGPNSIGDLTDIGHWWLWFRGPDSQQYMDAVMSEKGGNSPYSRLGQAPAGNNKIVMFKSCFPNSALQGNPGDAVPAIGSNPLKGQDSSSEYMTVANAKGIYMDILNYFRQHTDTMFVAVTAPPLIDPTCAGNARAFNQWLANDWLDGYDGGNVFVYDFYNVLTSNGGSPDVNDLDSEGGNHHRIWNGSEQHLVSNPGDNTAAYPSEDDHPNWAGNQKATAEFVPWLNAKYNSWAAGQPGTATNDGDSQAPVTTEDHTVPSSEDGNTEISQTNNSGQIVVYIDGQELYCEVPPMVQESRVLVPLRAIFEALGAELTWNDVSQQALAMRGETYITLTLWDPVAEINGDRVVLDVPPQAVSNRILVPLRFVAEALGAEAIWHGESQTVEIRTGGENAAGSPAGSSVGSTGGNPPGSAASCSTLIFYLDSTTYYADGTAQNMESPPIAIDGRSYMPVRYAAEPLGAVLAWEGTEQKATISANGRVIELWIGRNNAMVNGVQVQLDQDNPDAAPFVSAEGRTMVPVRFIAENLGYSVKYKNVDGSIVITSGV